MYSILILDILKFLIHSPQAFQAHSCSVSKEHNGEFPRMGTERKITIWSNFTLLKS